MDFFSNAAATGFIGVIVGATMTIGKDYFLTLRKEAKAEKYLCIRVVSELERFAAGCVDVVGDDGEENPNGYTVVTTKTPEFEPHSIDVDWESLPLTLLYRTLDLPNQLQAASREIEDVLEHVASPPDYPEFYEERQFQFAKLGLQALELAADLRLRAGLPGIDNGEWSSISFLRERYQEFIDLRAKKAARYAQYMQP